MKKQDNSHQEVSNIEESVFEKFPKPRTMPSQWDISELSPSETESKDDQKESGEIFEKFPKPRTMPMQWDTSDLEK